MFVSLVRTIHPHPLVGEPGGVRHSVQLLDAVVRRRQRLAHLRPTGNRGLAGGDHVVATSFTETVPPSDQLRLRLAHVHFLLLLSGGVPQEVVHAVNHQGQTLCGGSGPGIELEYKFSVTLNLDLLDRVGRHRHR